MDILSEMILNNFETFLLVFIRMTGLFIIAPIFGRRNVPAYIKIGFAFFTAIILVNSVSPQKADIDGSIFTLAILIIKEFLIGVTIGYTGYMVFSAIYIAGQLIDMQIGFAMVNVLDPLSNIQIPVTSNFYYIICMLVFLIIKGHHSLIKALFDSYNLVPLGTAAFDKSVLDEILKIFADTFSVSFRISAPVIAAILITDVALGVISRTIPQMNVFVVGMPLKILIGLGVILLTLTAFVSLVGDLTAEVQRYTLNILKDLGPVK